MTQRNRARAAAAGILIATLVLPLAGAWVRGRDLGPIFTFPPRLSVPTASPRFSWIALVLVLAPFAALAIAWVAVRRSRPPSHGPAHLAYEARAGAAHRMPRWGWAALIWIIAWWVLAWNRFPWFAPVQRYTFFPLWFGFIMFVNGFTLARTGTCLITRTPLRWLALFAVSAAFWWVFEWLNRFSHNWHYLGVADFGARAYALNATLCFSTVLPAVAAVAEWLARTPAFVTACASGPRLRWLHSRVTAVALIVGGIVALVGTGLAPARFYAALWAAPLALLVGESLLSRRGDLPAEVARGDWLRTATWALAALVCGVLWEMWNVHSAAKWIYTVPYVTRWHIFEMPLLGYTGYLPFGLECYFVITRVLGTDVVFSKASST